jgi:hypothetical protein
MAVDGTSKWAKALQRKRQPCSTLFKLAAVALLADDPVLQILAATTMLSKQASSARILHAECGFQTSVVSQSGF